MSVFSKYCDKLIFESVNDIEISDNDIIAELDDSGYVDFNSQEELRNILDTLSSKGYIFNDGQITTADEIGLKDNHLDNFNIKSVSPDKLTFISSLGKVSINQGSDINGYITSDDINYEIELTIEGSEDNNNFNLNGVPIKKLYIILKPKN